MVSGLTKGETYVFRVQAINELGLSDESQESAPLTVKAALSQYWHIVIDVDRYLLSVTLLDCDKSFDESEEVILYWYYKYYNSMLPFQPPLLLLTTWLCWTVTANQWFWTGRSLCTVEAQRSRSIMWTKDAVEQTFGGRFTSQQSQKDCIRYNNICH